MAMVMVCYEFLGLFTEKKGKGCLSWPHRLQVAIGIAKAVDYLHHGTHKCVVHRDIKPSNVLLSRRKTAKVISLTANFR